MSCLRILLPFFLAVLLFGTNAKSAENERNSLNVYSAWTHVRSVAEREWSSFPETRPPQRLNCEFDATATDDEGTLTLRQCDVKQTWTVTLNGKLLGRLTRDENDQFTDFSVPGGTLVTGKNRLEIEQTGQPSADDILVGQISLRAEAPAAVRRDATIQIEITDSNGQRLPGRITIVNRDGTLVPVGATSDLEIAVRSGVIYTVSGSASFGVSAGQYTLFASRGMEYGVDSLELNIEAGQPIRRTFVLDRTVDTEGWIACDTHIHTVTHSGHGDATIEERMVTLAGECIELPIATDHNKQIDYAPVATKLAARPYFTPVIGNEVTTKQGHFNIFPIRSHSGTPDAKLTDWKLLREEMFSVPDVQVAILNHGRDIHSGFRPLSPQRHVSISGERLDDTVLPVNAMELINSGAVQTDAMPLFSDWCGLINRGMSVTPVGSSDSHDVSRYIVGQARTYIQCDDSDVAAIDIGAATKAFLEGRVVVSYGMFLNVRVNDKFGPGELVSLGNNDLNVTAEVRAPDWVNPTQVELFVNGQLHQSKKRRGDDSSRKADNRWIVDWKIPRNEIQQDVWVTVVAKGDGIHAAFWPTAKPYQPDAIDFTPYTFACTGAIRVDVDGDNEFQSANDYARSIADQAGGNVEIALDHLKSFDPSVAIQLASILLGDGTDPDALAQFARQSNDATRNVVNQYLRSRRNSEIARLEQQE